MQNQNEEIRASYPFADVDIREEWFLTYKFYMIESGYNETRLHENENSTLFW